MGASIHFFVQGEARGSGRVPDLTKGEVATSSLCRTALANLLLFSRTDSQPYRPPDPSALPPMPFGLPFIARPGQEGFDQYGRMSGSTPALAHMIDAYDPVLTSL